MPSWLLAGEVGRGRGKASASSFDGTPAQWALVGTPVRTACLTSLLQPSFWQAER